MNSSHSSRVRYVAKAVQGAKSAALLLVAASLSGCAWFGWGGSDKKPQPLPVISGVNAASVTWSANVGKSGGYLFTPGFGDRVIYATARDGSIYALAEDGGRVVTRLDAKERVAGGVGVSQDIVVVASAKGDIIALDSAGRSLWKSSVSGEVLAPPTVATGNVIVRTSDGRILALNRIDGKRKWVFQRAAPALTLRTNAAVVVNRGVIYAGYPGGKVMAIELESGKPIWEATISLARGATELERIADVAGLPVLDDTRICAAVYQGRTGCVETLNGNVLWSREISSADGVAIDAKYLYVADIAGNVYALDKTNGQVSAWNPNAAQVVNVLAVAGDLVYVGGNFTSIGGQTRNRVAALNANATTNYATSWDPNANKAVYALAVEWYSG